MAQDLIQKLKEKIDESQWPTIEKAIDLAKEAHKNQKRLTGEDYVNHPLRTALILADLKLGVKTLAAAILHDVYEDTPVPLEEIRKRFGKDVAFLVKGVSKLGKLKYRGGARQAENLRRLFMAMAEDIRAILIKLADRLDNLQSLYALPPEKARRIALESIEIYAPIAYRLGMGELKGKLEDAAFPHAYPQEYEWLMKQVKEAYEERENYLKKVKPILIKELKREGIKFLEIHSRPKHYYSLYKKLQRYDMDISKIYDLVALRIIVETVEDCYLTLGIIHKLWKPLPGRIKDYIALPKPNGYRSLHTTVFCLDGKITEFQIRTLEMHKEAEFGIAAHWYYSEQKGLKKYLKRISPKVPEKEFKWVRQLREWQENFKATCPDEFIESLKIEFFKDRIFVFTPKGDVIDLPEGSTPVDFAYRIHTDIGNHCAGAKVNGKLIPLSYKLQNGDIVEILINKRRNPNRDWLSFVKTSIARSHIKKYLKSKNNKKLSKIETLKEIPKKIPPIRKILSLTKKKKQGKIKVAGHKGIMMNLAKCCHPQTGDKIIGYITKTKGISIHRADCKNLKTLKARWPEKIIKAEWI